MNKKRHAKVYVISDDTLREMLKNEPDDDSKRAITLEARLEESLAYYDSVRAKCFSSANLEGVAVDDKGPDWEMTMALKEAMIQTCDVVAVLGGTVTPEMSGEIRLAADLGKEICVSEPLRNTVRKLNVKVSGNPLAKVCEGILQKA